MYGLLIVATQYFVEQHFSPELWPVIVERADLPVMEYKTQKVYSEYVIKIVMEALSVETGLPVEELFYLSGQYFISFLFQHGYEKLIRVYGRTFIHFLREMDDIHEPLRFAYPHIKVPSFSVVYESPSLIRLVYSSKRTGFEHYVRGQVMDLAKKFFDINISIKIISRRKAGPLHHVTYDITHDGKSWGMPDDYQLSQELQDLGTMMRGSEFFKLSSFYLLLNRQLKLVKVSAIFKRLDPTLEGASFSDKFSLLRPYIEPTFENLKIHRHNTFELVLASSMESHDHTSHTTSASQEACRFKGQMCFAEEWNMVLFLGSPLVRSTQQLQCCGLYISDLNMFDQSTDLVFAGDRQSERLLNLFKKQVDQCKQLEKSMRRVGNMRKLTNELLFQCIPRGVARKLQDGTPAMETIQAYDAVSICFTKVVTFGAKCMEISVQQIVELLNQMYTLFDALTEMHNVYKVETIGDSYMLVSGAPQHTPLHAAHITEMALQILEAAQKRLLWPQKPKTATDELQHPRPKEPLQLFIGCNSGPIVAGVVGYKTPRYCLFGDTVNTASRMMSNGLPDKIHISQSFADALAPYPYVVNYRGKIVIKGKGEMDTYFIEGRAPEFTAGDGITDNRRSFTDVLKDDLDRSDDSMSEQSTTEESISDAYSDTASENNNLTSERRSRHERWKKASKYSNEREEGKEHSESICATEAAESGGPAENTGILRPLEEMRISTRQTVKATSLVKPRWHSRLDKVDRKGNPLWKSRQEIENRGIATEDVLQLAADRLANDTRKTVMQQKTASKLQNTCPTDIHVATARAAVETVSDDDDELSSVSSVSDSDTESSTEESRPQDEGLWRRIQYVAQRTCNFRSFVSDSTIVDNVEAAQDELTPPESEF